jgi:glycosyltransferase involved in cell wall biosynthesis
MKQYNPKTGKYDLVHCHSIASLHYDLSWIAAKLLHIPIVVTGHYSPDDLDRLWSKRRSLAGIEYWPARLVFWRSWMKFALRRTDRIIAIAESERQRMIKYFGIKPDQITVIPNGVDPEEFDNIEDIEVESFRVSRGINNSQKLILFVGRIARLKGIDILVEASIHLVQNGFDGTFMILGPPEDPDFAHSLKNRISEAGLVDRFIFDSISRHDVAIAFKASDIVVLPSRGEVFGITLVEGMYCGKVVVGSNTGGIPEVIDHGQTGFLFECDNAEDLFRVLKHILTDYHNLSDIRHRAKEAVMKRYTWEGSARQLLTVYEELLNAKKESTDNSCINS